MQDRPEEKRDRPKEKLRLFQLLSQHEGWPEILIEALQEEKAEEERYRTEGFGRYYGFEWFKVHTPVPTLHKMVYEKVLDITLATRSATHFRVRDPELVLEVLQALYEPETQQIVVKTIPEDLFDIIVGDDKIITIVRYAIDADKPVHLLLVGPPA